MGHDGLTGRITTFNWDATSTSNQLHLANQQYNICIRPAEGMCCVQYTPCDFDASFTTTAMGALASCSLDSSGTGAITVDTGSLCLDDYINIDGAGSMCQQGKNAVTSGRLCGVVFGGGIAKPLPILASQLLVIAQHLLLLVLSLMRLTKLTILPLLLEPVEYALNTLKFLVFRRFSLI